MHAIDTNILVRYLVRDPPDQVAQVDDLIQSTALFVGVTVLLETEWILRSVYEFEPRRIIAALRALAGLENVTIEDPAEVLRALDWAEQGMDFADALHLSRAEGCRSFVSFDRGLARKARKVGSVPVREP
jgi:predicted nucleic-acid-binding protein